MNLNEIIEPVRQAEKIAPFGSYEHNLYVKEALRNAWPKIKAMAEFERLQQDRKDA